MTNTPTPSTLTCEFDCATVGRCAVISKIGASYPPPGAASLLDGFVLANRSRTGGPTFFVEMSGIRCDTSSLPDTATILTCKLQIKTESEPIQNDDSRNLTMAWADAEVAWTTADFELDAGTNAHAGTSLSAFSPSTVYDITLINCSNVDVDGFTGLKMWVDGGQPANDNIISFFGQIAPKPQLIVTYQP